MAKKAQIPLTERQARELTTLLSQAITDTGSNRKARIYREVLEMLDHAVFPEE